MKVALHSVTVTLLGAALLAGCAGVRAHKGAVVDSQLASAIQPGIDNKASVEKTLGRPSFTGQFTPNDWYYVSRDTNQFAFRNPRVAKQTVYRVRFDQAGNVAAVDTSCLQLLCAFVRGTAAVGHPTLRLLRVRIGAVRRVMSSSLSRTVPALGRSWPEIRLK